MKNTLIGSAGSLEGLLKLTRGYFYSPFITFGEDGSVINSKGPIPGLRWTQKGNRFRLERVES